MSILQVEIPIHTLSIHSLKKGIREINSRLELNTFTFSIES